MILILAIMTLWLLAAAAMFAWMWHELEKEDGT